MFLASPTDTQVNTREILQQNFYLRLDLDFPGAQAGPVTIRRRGPYTMTRLSSYKGKGSAQTLYGRPKLRCVIRVKRNM